MGQKVNPILFRLSVYPSNLSSWHGNLDLYPKFLSQDLELRHFLSNTLRSRGILLRSCKIRRSCNKLWIDLDLFFSYMLTKQAKFVWARSLFKTIKKKYVKISRIRDLKNFVSLYDTTPLSTFLESSSKKKYVLSYPVRNKVFCGHLSNSRKNFRLSYRTRLFFFLVLKNQKFFKTKEKDDIKLLSTLGSTDRSLLNRNFVRLNFPKFNRLFVLQRFLYNFRSFFLKKLFPNFSLEKDTLDLLELNRNLSKSIQNFCGVEEVNLRVFSNQLNYVPSFKFLQRQIFKELSRFQRNRDLKNYFIETLETLYFVLRTFGLGNAYLLSQFLVFLLEKIRKQVSVVKFLKKSLEVFFHLMPPHYFAIDGIKILIKGRFNKRRRTKKVVLQQGQISLQTIRTPIDYFQTQAVTIYGTFGIKVWISKR
uniref:Ribosomal protein S3 n=1 Tax=Trachydiscus minutus TaxID=1032745 RepID=A0A140F2Q0_9STRA|nr:ribosomal protein S3 [Trachydiscus minutus]AML60684.1 ribosomal protein S3 [Trachydiscus minutus]